VSRDRESVNLAYTGPGDDPLIASEFMNDVLDRFKSERVTVEEARHIIRTKGSVVSAWGLADDVRRKVISRMHLKRMPWFCPVFPLCERRLHAHAFESPLFAYPWFQHNQLRPGESPCPGFTQSDIDSVHMEAVQGLYTRLRASSAGTQGHAICSGCGKKFDLFKIDMPYYIKEEKNWLYTGADHAMKMIRPDLTIYRDKNFTQPEMAIEVYNKSLSKPHKLAEFKNRNVHCIEIEAKLINHGNVVHGGMDHYLHFEVIKGSDFDYFAPQTGYKRKYCDDCKSSRKIAADKKRKEREEAHGEALRHIQDGKRWTQKARERVVLIRASILSDMNAVEHVQNILNVLTGHFLEVNEALSHARESLHKAISCIGPSRFQNRPQRCSQTGKTVIIDVDSHTLLSKAQLLLDEIDAVAEEVQCLQEATQGLRDADQSRKQEQARAEHESRLRELQDQAGREAEERARAGQAQQEERMRREADEKERRLEERRQTAHRVRSAHNATRLRYATCGGAQRAGFDEAWLPRRGDCEGASQVYEIFYFEVYRSDNGWRWKIEDKDENVAYNSERDYMSEEEAKLKVGEFWFLRRQR
jgi:hypothetical protein